MSEHWLKRHDAENLGIDMEKGMFAFQANSVNHNPVWRLSNYESIRDQMFPYKGIKLWSFHDVVNSQRDDRTLVTVALLGEERRAR